MGNCGVCRICLPYFPSSAFRASTDRVCTNPPTLLFPRPRHPGHNSRPFSPQCDMAKRGRCAEKRRPERGRQGFSLSPFPRSVTFVRTTKKREGIFIYWNRKHVRSYIWGMIFRVDQNFCKFCLAACKRRGEDSILPC